MSARCTTQVSAVLDALEARHGALTTPFWAGDAPGHADIAVACAIRFLGEAHPDIAASGRWPGLTAHGARCEALAAFATVVQPFIPPR
jgi:glutathione S-transferase